MHGCLRCNDTGMESCFECFGFGQITCGCGGQQSCPKCEGLNRRDCPDCGGTGRRKCQLCRGAELTGGPGQSTRANLAHRHHLRLVRPPNAGGTDTR